MSFHQPLNPLSPTETYIQIVLAQLNLLDASLLQNLVRDTQDLASTVAQTEREIRLNSVLDDKVSEALQTIDSAQNTTMMLLGQKLSEEKQEERIATLDELIPFCIEALSATNLDARNLQLMINKIISLIDICENLRTLYPNAYVGKDPALPPFVLTLTRLSSIFTIALQLQLEKNEQKEAYDDYNRRARVVIAEAETQLPTLVAKAKQNSPGRKIDFDFIDNELQSVYKLNKDESLFEQNSRQVRSLNNVVEAAATFPPEQKTHIDSLSKKLKALVPPPTPTFAAPSGPEQKPVQSQLSDVNRRKKIVDKYLLELWGGIRQHEKHLPLTPQAEFTLRDPKTKTRKRYEKYIVVHQLKQIIANENLSLNERLMQFDALLMKNLTLLTAHRKKGAKFFMESHGLSFVKEINPSFVAEEKPPLLTKIKSMTSKGKH